MDDEQAGQIETGAVDSLEEQEEEFRRQIAEEEAKAGVERPQE